MTPQALQSFIEKYGLNSQDLADLLGLTRMAVDHWLAGRRSIAKPFGRLMRLFDRHPALMKEFK